MTEPAIIETLKSFLERSRRVRRDQLVNEDDSLLGRGIIDSLAIMELTAFIETTFGIKIGDSDLVPENFDSLSAIKRYIEAKLLGKEKK